MNISKSAASAVRLFGLVAFLFFLGACSSPTNSDGDQNGAVSYAADVQPVFDNNCAVSGCHDATGNSGGLTLTNWENLMAGDSNHGPVVTEDNGPGSFLIKALRGTAEGIPRMPNGGTPLADDIIDQIESWIDAGAKNN